MYHVEPSIQWPGVAFSGRRDLSPDETKNFLNIAGRKKAIHKSISLMKKDDILLIAGKGHEKTQEIKGRKIDFDDQKVAKEAILIMEKL